MPFAGLQGVAGGEVDAGSPLSGMLEGNGRVGPSQGLVRLWVAGPVDGQLDEDFLALSPIDQPHLQVLTSGTYRRANAKGRRRKERRDEGSRQMIRVSEHVDTPDRSLRWVPKRLKLPW